MGVVVAEDHYRYPACVCRSGNLPSVCEAEDREDPLAPNSSLLASVLIGGVTICLAAFSWHLFERPINNLKRYFKYEGDRSPKKIAPSG